MIERMRTRVSEGMPVKSADGEKLGKVVACQPAGFVVEKGFLFPKDLLVPYERISGITNGEIVLSLARAELEEAGAGKTAAGTARAGGAGVAEEVKGAAQRAKEATTGTNAEATMADGGNGHAGKKGEVLAAFGTAGEIRVQLSEEEIVTSKRVEKVGEVHVRKEIITEEKQITVPVTREVIRVERVAVSHEAHAEDHPFEEVSYDIPIREEHVTIEKHSVVHEELRIGKEIQRAEETASATVRRERAEVETLGPVRRAEGSMADAAAMRPTGTGGR
jgi:uncharacterized protein (TIGR02271 family)